MKTRVALSVVIVWVVLYGGSVWGFTEGDSKNFFGTGAGNGSTTGNYINFIGGYSGNANTTGSENSFFGYGTGFLNTTGSSNTFVGYDAGYHNTTGNNNSFFGWGAGYLNTGSNNTFLGEAAGYYNDIGYSNSFLGRWAGLNNTAGHNNTFLGDTAGYYNSTGFGNIFLGNFSGYSNNTGNNNTFLGSVAGYSNSTGSGNVFVGNLAGYFETGSNKLYIDNSQTWTPLIYGEFDNNLLRINGGGHFSGLGVSKSQLHFSLDNTDTGGWITSVLDNNFFVSSGAAYDASLGGWVQKSPDGKAVIAGSGATGYRVQTRTGCAIGTVCSTPMTRLMIDYSGNVGLGVAPTHPLQLAGGAYSDGTQWVDVSSREYKEDIESLSTDEALVAIKDLNPVKYAYKADRTQKHVGFIAEDVPDLVATKDRKGLSPMDIVAVLTKVVQEQRKAMQEQQGLIKKLEQRLLVLEGRGE